MKKRRIAGIGALALGVIAAAWLTLSPYWTLSSMQGAVERHDAAALSEHIDYASVRTNLKAQLAVTMASVMARDPNHQGAGKLAMAYADQMVDSFVRPETMANVLAGSAKNAPARKRLTGDDVEVNRLDITHFIVSKKGEQGGLTFQLQGVTWKLVSIQAPQL